ncbi:MAG: universal stress protein, partial [Candidatus Calescibacterium sp.]
MLIGYDGSDGAKKALTKGIEIAEVYGAEIYILSVGRIPEYA